MFHWFQKKRRPISDEFAGEVQEYTLPYEEEFDPGVDVEWLGGAPPDRISARKKMLFENYEPLPSEELHIICETSDPAGFTGRVLLASSEADAFLQSEPEILRLFDRAYEEAYEDWHGYIDPAKIGRGDHTKRINGSLFDLCITLTQAEKADRYRIDALLQINPDD